MADANRTLVTRAEYNTILYPATGRKALVMDGENIELGDSGRRNMTQYASDNLTSGRIFVHRVGYNVTWYFLQVVSPASTAGTTFPLLNASYDAVPIAPDQTIWVRGWSGDTRLGVSSDGVPVIRTSDGAAQTAVVSFTFSRRWWMVSETLPGAGPGETVGI